MKEQIELKVNSIEHSVLIKAHRALLDDLHDRPQAGKQVTHYLNQEEPLRVVLLDGIGRAAVDFLTEQICKFMAAEASSRGYRMRSPVSPGMRDLRVTEQWQLFKMVRPQEIGVSLTSSEIMVPRESAYMAIGIGPQMKTWT